MLNLEQRHEDQFKVSQMLQILIWSKTKAWSKNTLQQQEAAAAVIEVLSIHKPADELMKSEIISLFHPLSWLWWQLEENSTTKIFYSK